MISENGGLDSGSSSSTVSNDITDTTQSTHCVENSHVIPEAPGSQASTSHELQNRAHDLEQDSHAQEVELDSDSNIESADEDSSCQVQEAQSLLRDARFASRDLLCPWFPEADPSHKRARTLSKRLSRRQLVLTMACLTSWLIFVVNLVATIYLPLRHSDARLFSGSCTTASQLDSGLHVLINGLSSLLLGASNLCMQLLSAPTRNEVDKAHEQKVWLDIGVPSMLRNFKWVATERKIVLVILAVGSLPLHFL